MILECKKISGHLVVPVSYHVEPSDVRYQTGSIKEAFDGYEEKLKEEESKKEWMERVNGWRAALKEVADLSGMVLQNQSDGHESKFIQKIIKLVTAKVNRSALKIPQFHVGLDSRTKSINLWLNDESADVDMLVIWGMGGMGKTTIAKYVYNSNHLIFVRSCSLANIREICNQSNGLLTLQRQLLSNILRGQKEEIYNVAEGTTKIEDAICLNRVFIVLDDVDDLEQLDILIGTQDFYPGSKIIITTRNKWLLKARKNLKLHEVKMLDDVESLKLFSWHAFEQVYPLEGYTDQSTRVVQRCRGLPLALKVLGRSLTGKCINVWESALQKLKAIPKAEIQKVLKISYDLLEDDYDRNLFLDIACFFVGEDKSYIVTILDKSYNYSTEDGMQNLIERSLLSTDYEGKLEMHQLIQEMGREIIRQESPKDPGKRTRLWHHEDSFSVMKRNEGTESIEGLVLDMHMFKDSSSVKPSFDVSFPKKHQYEEYLDNAFNKVTSLVQPYFSFLSRQSEHTDLRGPSGVELSIKAFERMKRLRLLQLKYVQFIGSWKNFPGNLTWLSWHGFPAKYIPTYLTLSNLVALDMRYSMLEQVWERTMVLPLLQNLDLSHSQRLWKVHNFLGLQNLERLILKGCVSLVDICDSICNLERLVVLDLEDCKKLEKLPRNIRLLGSLETLVISGCSNLVEFQDEGTILSRTLSRSLICLSLPSSLVRLSLEKCNLSEDSFPKYLSQLTLLRELKVGYNPIKTLPESIKSLTNLVSLNVDYCDSLQSMIGLPSSICFLSGFPTTSLKRITFESKPHSFKAQLGDMLISEVQGFFRLEPIGAVDSDLINDLGLINVESLADHKVELRGFFEGELAPIQGLHEFGIFSTYIPADKVPSWFRDENRRLSSSFTVPSTSNNSRIRGLNVCTVYCIDDSNIFWLVFTKIHNETKNLTWIYLPRYVGFLKNGNEELAWLSHWKFGNQLEGGDVVTVTVGMTEQIFHVKEIGINLVYGEMEDCVPENIDDQVIGGDLTNFQLTTGAYFLANSYPEWEFDDKCGYDKDLMQRVCGDNINNEDTDLTQRLFGDNIKIEEFRDWTWTGCDILCDRNSP